VFLLEGQRFRYGFEATSKKIVSEWLYEGTKPLFLRIEEGIEVKPKFKEGRDLEARTRDNALFLAVVDQFNGAITKKVFNWFKTYLLVVSGIKHDSFRDESISTIFNFFQQKQASAFFKNFDLGFDSFQLSIPMSEEKLNKQDIFKFMIDGTITDSLKNIDSNYTIATNHKKLNEKGEVIGNVNFDLEKQEFSGTNKLFDIAGPVFTVLNNGGLLIVDELDAKLHPLLTLAILRLFHSTENNPNNAQLIFATHDTNLLSMGNLRRDQICFTEKNQYEATDLYALVEYKDLGNGTVRKVRSFAKDYIQGRYGAIPFVGDFSKMTEAWQKK
jgi:uncharacterized protein